MVDDARPPTTPATPDREPTGDRRSLAGRIAVVAGAGASGPGWSIGKACCVTLARRGATIVALDLNAGAAAETAREVEAVGGKALALTADVADPERMAAVIAEVLERFGRIDLYQANAGIGRPGDVETTPLDDWRRAQQVNVESLLISTRLVIPAMRAAGRGAIVTVLSVAGLRYLGYPHLAYSVTKAAVIHFTRMLAQQYAADGIRANCVVPGLIDTPRIRHTVASQFADDLDTARRARDRQVPLGRMGTAWEVADAVAFLASDEAAYITGTELVVDGGLIGKFT